MLIGFNLPVSGPMAAPATMQRMAQLGERLGFDYLTLTDHVVLPDTSVPGYPYSESGAFYSPDPGRRHEQLTAAAWVAAKTERIRLVLAVLVVPHRPAVLTAKMLATIDVLSGGRLTVGVGAGWLQPELETVAVTPFAERGAVTDEYLDAFRLLWTQEKPAIAGKYVRYQDLVFDPKPVQRPHPPIWVGGESGPSMRRAARVSDAWYPIGSNNAHLLDTLPRLEAGIAKLRKLAAAAGRDPASVGVVYRVKRHGQEAPPASDGNRRLFTGSIDQVLRDIEALRKIGVTGLDFDFEGQDADLAAEQMERFKGEVLDRVDR
ncbi:TIGR03619 family F420-dependent LLM class oxidoreductase [Siccirubricoccus sp. KC 17139]|uniref:TIGR03619 family F420-dependent LLM class oxidoreductase n=1 Tax=Siccirubricoccus soli TaxID=2899147 RepID=A0ABT1D5J8_9PROT|nr:TIGR03619 family F420-dependent LLM class oxidoreductase [Siccirubricoccus soli]MCO6417139.1 TIGR03619 family F420-dependent LLM class oxidoreductase [Siccirubricoccus soli]MCP2683274.1 TIGR03619 family F420-dependent LLM class oxidoreductase [Siccirubricoccus soli]